MSFPTSNSPISSFSSSNSSDNEQEVTYNQWQAAYQQLQTNLQLRIAATQEEAEGSRTRRRRTHIERGREEGHAKLYNDYFRETPTYTDEQFRRRFRMRRHIFMRIVDRLSTEVEYFQQSRDATGRLGLSALQKCTAAIRMLAYGVAADACDEYVRIGADTARKCLYHFFDGIITFFGDEYLRRPTSADIQRLLSVGESRGFPGMLGSIDCMHWRWKNCPAAWKWMYARGDHDGPTIILEAVASYDLWIWHAFFGTPGTCNNINVLDRSPVFDDVLQGVAPNANFTVNEHEYNMGYYLADGIYPPWATFVQTIRLPQGQKAKLFAQQQESYRKDVERTFGVLQSRFAIVRNPALSWKIENIGKIMRACIIIHNMIVEDERDGYETNGFVVPLNQGEHQGSDETFSTRDDNLSTYITNRYRLRNRVTHHQLKEDLVEHVWQRFGAYYDQNDDE